MKPSLCFGLLVLLSVVPLHGDEGGQELRLDAPADWRGERISLPPGFAPDMKLRGVEEIRFAPGMFDAESDSFFSYVFVFQVEPMPELTKELLQEEMLRYYRGLAAAVLKGSDVAVDPDSFALKLEASTPIGDADRPAGLAAYVGDLNWLEPFVSRQRQTLRLELEAWRDAESKRNYLFVCASPQPGAAAIWPEMRKIRASFQRAR